MRRRRHVLGTRSDGFAAGRLSGIGLARARMPIAGEGHDRSRGLAGELAGAGEDAEASLILDSGCRVPLAGDGLGRSSCTRSMREPSGF